MKINFAYVVVLFIFIVSPENFYCHFEAEAEDVDVEFHISYTSNLSCCGNLKIPTELLSAIGKQKLLLSF